MSTLGCALRCPHTLPASVLTVTMTKRLTAEITVTTLHRNWGSTLSLFLFFYFLVCSDKNDPLFPMNTLLHAVALPLFLPPLPSASQSITILQQEGLSLCFTPGVSRPSPSPVGMGCFFFSPSSASLTHPLPTNHWSSACAALPAFNACCIVCAEHKLEVAGERLVSAFWAIGYKSKMPVLTASSLSTLPVPCLQLLQETQTKNSSPASSTALG